MERKAFLGRRGEEGRFGEGVDGGPGIRVGVGVGAQGSR
jgi:hypothetical protein